MSYLIIGVDPGHTIGLSALDLTGRPIRSAHLLQGGFGAALSTLESWGTPSVIASDVRPAPELVLKLASAFNAALFIPQSPWREDDKRQVARQLLEQSNFQVENVHERDALSAAVQAWRAHQNLLRQAPPPDLSAEEADTLRHLLLQGIRQTWAVEMVRKLRQPEPGPSSDRSSGRGSISAPGSAPSTSPSASAPLPIASPSAPLPAFARTHPHAPSSALMASTLSQERTLAELRKRIAFLEAERESLLGRIRLLENGVIGERQADREHQKMAAQIQRLQAHIHYLNKRHQRRPSSPTALSPHPSGAAPHLRLSPQSSAPSGTDPRARSSFRPSAPPGAPVRGPSSSGSDLPARPAPASHPASPPPRAPVGSRSPSPASNLPRSSAAAPRPSAPAPSSAVLRPPLAPAPPSPAPAASGSDEADLKKLNALRLARMIEEYRLNRASSNR